MPSGLAQELNQEKRELLELSVKTTSLSSLPSDQVDTPSTDSLSEPKPLSCPQSPKPSTFNSSRMPDAIQVKGSGIPAFSLIRPVMPSPAINGTTPYFRGKNVTAFLKHWDNF